MVDEENDQEEDMSAEDQNEAALEERAEDLQHQE